MVAAALFRQHNCLAAQLGCSLCVFRVTSARDDGASDAAARELHADLLAGCRRVGGVLDMADTDQASTVTLEASHASVDAFGGMYLLARWLPLPAASPAGRGAVAHRSARAGGFDYHHFVVDAPDDAGSSRGTLTQRAIGAILEALDLAPDARVAVVVAKDDPRVIDETTYPGNSLVMLELARATLDALARGPREAWRAALTRDSDRLRAIALKRPDLLKGSAVDVTFSSVGDVARIPWAAALDPSFFEMVPTPASDRSATVVLWGRGARQALTLCARKEHVVMRRADAIRAAWEGVLA